MNAEAEHPETDTLTALEALLARIVDYAGLFPPATLDMASTVRNYASYTESEHAWMLGRLIVPLSRIDEFEQCAADLLPGADDAEPWHISGLTAPAGDDSLAANLERIETFNRHHAAPANGLARIDVIELKADTAGDIESALELMPDEIYPFFELPPGNDLRGLAAALVGSDAGAKVRTGGVTADLYPLPLRLAAFIAVCVGAGVPFKATAGLHHPVRHFSAAVSCKEFGFLNVFVAAALLHNKRIDAGQLATVLEDEDASNFTFDSDGLAWRDRRLATENIIRTREHLAISFGSCSFEEPIEDLRALGLL